MHTVLTVCKLHIKMKSVSFNTLVEWSLSAVQYLFYSQFSVSKSSQSDEFRVDDILI